MLPGTIIIKKGKYGNYVEWGKNKQSISDLGNKPIDTITYMDVINILEKDKQNQKSKD